MAGENTPAPGATPPVDPAATPPVDPTATPPVDPAAKPDDGEGAKPGEGEGKKADGDKSGDDKGVPESYSFEAPEGVELDTVAVAEFSEIAKELKLSQADADRAVGVAIKMAQRQAEATAATVKGWADQCKADKEFGGDNLDANVAIAQKAIDTFGTPELKAILAQSGWGNHPEFVRFAYKAGKAMSDDTFAKGGNPGSSNEGKSLAERMYPNQK